MCGIAGYIGYKKLTPERICRTAELMKNRGPDNQDHIEIEKNGLHVALLHSRLTIIDLDTRSNQPMLIDGCCMVFNGEIYNYLELRDQLVRKGVVFSTESDSEVLLRAYLYYGEKCVDYFEGMWAFAIYDSRTGVLLLSRDRFAEKPLYYHVSEDGIYFGSEIKFIKSLGDLCLQVNYEHIYRYLVNGYKSLYKSGQGFYKEISELGYAENMIVKPDLSYGIDKYWKPASNPVKMSPDQAIEGFRHYLCRSIKLRLRSDVPIAFCLSGGIDSSSLVSIASKKYGYDVASFSIIDSDPRYNEYDNILVTVGDLDCRNTIIDIPVDHVFDRLKRLVEYHDVPVSTITYYIHSYLSEAISGCGYKVAVSGTGADEMITGYYDHFNMHLYETRNMAAACEHLDSWNRHIRPVVRNPFLRQADYFINDRDSRKHIYLNRELFGNCLTGDFHEEFFEQEFDPGLLRNRMMNELFHEIVPVILHEDDLNSMMYSVENRSPFLDRELFDFSFSIPAEYLIRDGYGKYILRESVKGILNDRVRLDRCKKGFNASFASIVDLSSSENIDYIMADGPVFDIMDRDKVGSILTSDPLPNSISKFLFNFLNVKMFLEMNS